MGQQQYFVCNRTQEIIEQDISLQKVTENGEYFKKQLLELQTRHELIGDVRGKGLILGVELVEDRVTKEPAAVKTAAICYRAYELGLIVFYVGVHGNVIEITPPLNIDKAEIDQAVAILEQAFKDVEAGNIDMNKVKQFAGW